MAPRGAERLLLATHIEGCATRALKIGEDCTAEAREEIVNLLWRFLR